MWEIHKTLMSFEMEGKRFRSGMEKNLEAHNRGNLNFVVITNAGYPGPWPGSEATFDIEMARPRHGPGVRKALGKARTSFGPTFKDRRKNEKIPSLD